MAVVSNIPSRSWSAFQRDAKSVADEAAESDILLRRRDGPDLVLGTAERHAEFAESVEVLARLLGAVVGDPALLRKLADPAVLPWLEFLSHEDRTSFAREFVATASAAVDLGSLVPLGVLLREWRNTALVHADPRLANAMRAEHHGDGVPISRPVD